VSCKKTKSRLVGSTIKLYGAIKRLNFGIMFSPQSLKFDLVFYHICFWFFMNIQKNQIKNRKNINFPTKLKTIEFLRNFFTKGLVIHCSFLSYFLSFSKNVKFKNWFFSSEFQFSKIPKFKFEKHWISNLKSHQILIQYQKVNPTTSKNTFKDVFRIILWKGRFYQNC
jgi:hypothetical protein